MGVNPFITAKSLEQVSEWVMNTPPPPQLAIRLTTNKQIKTPSFALFGGIYNSYARVNPTYNQPVAINGISDKAYTSVNCAYPGGFWSQRILTALKFPTPDTCPVLSDEVKANITNYLMAVPIKARIETLATVLSNPGYRFITLNPINVQINNNTTVSTDEAPCWEFIIDYEGVSTDCKFALPTGTQVNQVADNVISLQLSIRPSIIHANNSYTYFTALLVNSLVWRLKIITGGGTDNIEYGSTDNLTMSSTSSGESNSHAYPINMTSLR